MKFNPLELTDVQVRVLDLNAVELVLGESQQIIKAPGIGRAILPVLTAIVSENVPSADNLHATKFYGLIASAIAALNSRKANNEQLNRMEERQLPAAFEVLNLTLVEFLSLTATKLNRDSYYRVSVVAGDSVILSHRFEGHEFCGTCFRALIAHYIRITNHPIPARLAQSLVNWIIDTKALLDGEFLVVCPTRLLERKQFRRYLGCPECWNTAITG